MNLSKISTAATPEALFFLDGRKTTLFRYRKNEYSVRFFGKEKEFKGSFPDAVRYMTCGKERKHELVFKGLPDGAASAKEPALECVFTVGSDEYRLYRLASFGLYRIGLEQNGKEQAAWQGNLYDLITLLYDTYSLEDLLNIEEEKRSL